MKPDIERRIVAAAPVEASAKPPPAAAPIRKILVPASLPPRSLEAAAYAASLAASFGSELVFVHALQHGWPLGPAEREIRDGIREKWKPSRFLFREGSPGAVILQTAKEQKCDLIVMTTRGRPALARLLCGSITARVLREANCPVWVGLDNLAPLPARPIRNILCALSLGPRAGAVLRWSADLAGQLDASLYVVHTHKAPESNPGLPCDREWRLWVRKIARDDIRALQAGVGTRAEVWLEAGNPVETIPALAGRLQADLVVLGKSPGKRLFGGLRTLSYEIACRTPCPVASV